MHTWNGEVVYHHAQEVQVDCALLNPPLKHVGGVLRANAEIPLELVSKIGKGG